MRHRLCVVILTFNEGLHIARAIASIKAISDEIFVIDSYSSDDTVMMARSLGACVVQRAFVNQAEQFNWALDNLEMSSEWILRLDADEIIEPDLAANILRVLPALSDDVAGICFKRKHIFMGRWVRHGGRYPLTMLRLWRKGCGRVEARWMDEHVIVWSGKTITLEGGFCDHNLKDLNYFIDKHNKYATREAIQVLGQRYGFLREDKSLTVESAPRQAAVKRYIKERVYNQMPFTLSALLYFLWRYFFQLGFLDGRSGLVYHFLQGYWYRFLVGAKIMELEQAIRHLTEKDDIVREISRLTGYKLID